MERQIPPINCFHYTFFLRSQIATSPHSGCGGRPDGPCRSISFPIIAQGFYAGNGRRHGNRGRQNGGRRPNSIGVVGRGKDGAIEDCRRPATREAMAASPTLFCDCGRPASTTSRGNHTRTWIPRRPRARRFGCSTRRFATASAPAANETPDDHIPISTTQTKASSPRSSALPAARGSYPLVSHHQGLHRARTVWAPSRRRPTPALGPLRIVSGRLIVSRGPGQRTRGFDSQG